MSCRDRTIHTLHTQTFRDYPQGLLESVTLSSLIFGKTRKWSKALPLMFIGHMVTGAAHIISFSAAMLAHGLRRAARTAFKPNLVARTLRQTQQRTLPVCSQLCKYNKYLKLCSNFALEVGFFWEGARKKARCYYVTGSYISRMGRNLLQNSL